MTHKAHHTRCTPRAAETDTTHGVRLRSCFFLMQYRCRYLFFSIGAGIVRALRHSLRASRLFFLRLIPCYPYVRRICSTKVQTHEKIQPTENQRENAYIYNIFIFYFFMILKVKKKSTKVRTPFNFLLISVLSPYFFSKKGVRKSTYCTKVRRKKQYEKSTGVTACLSVYLWYCRTFVLFFLRFQDIYIRIINMYKLFVYICINNLYRL